MTPISPLPVRLFYVDDSGAPDTGWIVYSWIECTIADWRVGLRGWLDLRKKLYAQYAIPPAYELHAAHFAGGQGNPSTNQAWNRHKRYRGEVLQLALGAIAATEQLRVGTVYRVTGATGKAYAEQRTDVYEKLVTHLDTRLGASGEHGLIFMDGDGSDASYYGAHRALKLAHRNVIEDPLFQPSHRSQWVQMADIIAWSAYQGLRRAPNRRFAWEWYARYLHSRDVNGGPLAI
jgi:hypothetical protein